MQLTPTKKLLILLLDLFVVMSSYGIIYSYRLGGTGFEIIYAPGLWLVSFIVVASLYVFGAYGLDENGSFNSLLVRKFLALSAATSIIILVHYLFNKDRSGIFGRGVFAGAMVLFFIISALYRRLIWGWYQEAKQKLEFLFIINEKIKIGLEKDLYTLFAKSKFVFVDPADTKLVFENIKKQWASVVLALDINQTTEEFGKELMKARFNGQSIMDLTNFYEMFWRKVPIYFLGHNWFVLSDGFSLVHNPLGLRIKRLVDIFLSSLLILLSWPFMIIAYIAIKLESKGPALFSQVRTGKDSRDFLIYKFRSMRLDAEKDGAKWATKNDDRITKVGKFIRLTRIDELPQLFNVLKGDMSFVGPRPERPEFNVMLEKEIPFYNLRHMVRPGITGWAQVLYPYGASVEDSKEKLQYDLYYIKNYSIILDLVIVLKTINVVLFGRGR